MHFMRFFLILILQSSILRAFCALLSFQPVSQLFREQVLRAAVRSAVFLTLFFIISRAFPSRVIAYCSLLSAAVRCR
jgi:hypothetical protein